MTRLLLLLLALAVPAQQQPLAIFEGTVVDSVTGQPIAGAHVTISSNLYGPPETARQTSPPQQTNVTFRLRDQAGAPSPLAAALAAITNRDVYTDAQGKFAIADIPPVAYCLGAAAEGYVYQVYGQKTPFGSLTPVKLVAGNSLSNRLVVRLDPAAEVSGIVTNQDRKPLSAATVYLLRTAYSIDGGARPYVNGEARTDDTGKFSLKGVAAGTYRLIAGIELPVDNATRSVDLYAWTFYPGVTDSALAAKIDVLPGAHNDIGTISIQTVEPHAIRGRLVDSRTGKPPTGARINLVRRYPVDRAGRSSEESFFRTISSYDPTTGTFEFRNLPGDRYRIDVTLPAPANPAVAFSGGPFGTSVDAFTFVNLSTTDVNDVLLTVPGAATLHAKIVVTGESPLDIFNKTLPVRPQFSLRPAQSMQPSPSLLFVTSEDGTLEIRAAMQGRYRLNLGPLKENHYVSELRLDGVRAENNLLDIQPSSTAELAIIVRRDGGQIDGTVVDEKNQPVAGVRGVMLPDPVPEVIGHFYEVYSTPDGKFSMRGIEPGNYKAYVWDGLGDLQIFDRELWQRTRPFATPIRIDPGSRITTTIKVITP